MRESLDPQRWWERAEKDIRSAQLNLSADREGQAEVICYECQQACEKMLKAFLLKNGWVLSKVHDLIYLLEEAVKYLPEIKRFELSLNELNTLFMPSHYPYDVPEPIGGEEAAKSLLLAKEIHDILQPLVLLATK